MKDLRCLRYDGLTCFLRHEAGRWGCGVCGRVGFWTRWPGLRFHQRWLCRGAPRNIKEATIRNVEMQKDHWNKESNQGQEGAA